MTQSSPWRHDFALFSPNLGANEYSSNSSNTSAAQDSAASKQLHYLDSAATCLVPEQVVKTHQQFLQYEHANSHRSFYPLSAQLTERIEAVRSQVADFIGAPSAQQIIFTHGTTQAIHQIVNGYFAHRINACHNVVVTVAEHHANFIPWQQLALQSGAQLRVAKLDLNGRVDSEQLNQLIDHNTLALAITHASNVLGTTNPIEQITQQVKTINPNVKVVVDGAQFVGYSALDVSALGCDFYVFSGHKLYAGFGAGVLYGRAECINAMSPVILGGGMVERVDEHDSVWQHGVRRFEAGSLNSQAIVSLSAAIDYLKTAREAGALAYLKALAKELHQALAEVNGLELLVDNTPETSIVSFNMTGIHSHDIASLLAESDIAVRAGHHCAQPLHQFLGVKSSVRVSLGLYNDKQDIAALIKRLQQIQKIMLR